MFRRSAGNPQRPDALERVERATRRRFGLAPGDLVIVAEQPPARPGHPPVETVALFRSGPARHRFRVFPPAAEVGPDDLPPTRPEPSLIGDGGADCCRTADCRRTRSRR